MDYVELHAASAFSFLDGASLPEDLVDQARLSGLAAMALVDTNGVYGAPRFYKAANAAGLRPLVGAEVAFERSHGPRLTLLVASRPGYKNLCRLLTDAAANREKGAACVDWDELALRSEGLVCLTGGDEGPMAGFLSKDGGGEPAARAFLDRLNTIFPDRLYLEVQRHLRRDEEHRNRALFELAAALRLPLLATNGVRYARPDGKELYDVLSCIRRGTSLGEARGLLSMNRERHIKTPAEMAHLFRDRPDLVARTVTLASQLNFTLADLGYRFPDYPLPAGDTPISFLRRTTWDLAPARFHPYDERVRRQLEKELNVIEKLDLAGYFLIVWDIVNFCRREKIMVQGRGSAANSAVCFALGITAVDPVKMDLLFERFLSEERGEWPDIDLDLPSGDQRERAIQFLYTKYGARSAAMTANVITYGPKSAAREVSKAFGFTPQQAARLSGHLGRLSLDEIRNDPGVVGLRLRSAGLDPNDARVRRFARFWFRIQTLPRHLSQHSGGMVVAHGRLDEVVPLEPASMNDRVVIQWDKEDCADLGIIKVDLLGLGMLAAMEKAIAMIQRKEGVTVDLARIPHDDPKVFEMLRTADTVGLFQVESRAQMASLPRNAPTIFYDIVVQVAIIRPGPIVGGMVHPFFDRRQGKAPVEYPHPCLEPILKRTLGVPLFQEQVIRMAMVAAGFTGGEAEELRRAMGFKRSVERMDAIERRLRDGMRANGIVGKAQDQIVTCITSFALYGFPESHAASFALIAYASAYLKVHHPAAFYASLLNAWPMGFYHPSTLVKDAQRRGVVVFPVDVNASGWDCEWEAPAPEACHPGEGRPDPINSNHRRDVLAVSVRDPGFKPFSEEGPRTGPRLSPGRRQGFRIGLRYVKGLSERVGRRVEEESARERFKSPDDLARRCEISEDELTRLAHAGALASFGLERRDALWQVARIGRAPGPLFDGTEKPDASPLPVMTPQEQTFADYATSHLTTGPHLIHHFRADLAAQQVIPAGELSKLGEGAWVRVAGAIIVRQHPMTAKGFVFLTMEDETGMCQAIISPDLYRQNRTLIIESPCLIVEGPLQKGGGQMSVKAFRFRSFATPAAIPSHDFH